MCNLYTLELARRDRAHRKLSQDVETDHIKRSPRCYKCLAFTHTEASHLNFSQSLEVVWLCHSCHVQAHSRAGLPGVYVEAPVAP